MFNFVQAGSIGIIGGADGPTAIFVAKHGMDLINALSLCWKGMAGIFIVMILIALGVWLLARLTSDKHSETRE